MAVTPDSFLDHAERVHDKFDDEIAKRCAVSRGYYHTFHYIRESFPDEFEFGKGDHRNAIEFLKSKQGNLDKEFITLLDKRQKADYDLDNDDIDGSFVENFFNLMNTFITNFKLTLL